MSTEIFVLYDGYARVQGNIMRANCTCTLIKTDKINVICDTMTPWDGPKITEKLKDFGLKNTDIHYVVCTHGHSDHIGNNNLFLEATHIVGQSVSKGDQYYLDAFENGSNYEIAENIQVFVTPGHTLDSVSVKIETPKGVYVVAGDLFERQEDLKDEKIWLEAGSEDPDKQRESRKKVLKMADYIIPGHGPMFSNQKLCG